MQEWFKRMPAEFLYAANVVFIDLIEIDNVKTQEKFHRQIKTEMSQCSVQQLL